MGSTLATVDATTVVTMSFQERMQQFNELMALKFDVHHHIHWDEILEPNNIQETHKLFLKRADRITKGFNIIFTRDEMNAMWSRIVNKEAAQRYSYIRGGRFLIRGDNGDVQVQHLCKAKLALDRFKLMDSSSNDGDMDIDTKIEQEMVKPNKLMDSSRNDSDMDVDAEIDDKMFNPNKLTTTRCSKLGQRKFGNRRKEMRTELTSAKDSMIRKPRPEEIRGTRRMGVGKRPVKEQSRFSMAELENCLEAMNLVDSEKVEVDAGGLSPKTDLEDIEEEIMRDVGSDIEGAMEM